MIIRTASPKDGAGTAHIYAPIVEDTAISFEDVPPSADEMAARIETTLATHPWLVAEISGTIIGYAYATTHRSRAAYKWSCDVSVYIAPEARRTGTASALYDQLFATLIELGFASAFAGITLPNETSIGFHKQAGFTLVGIYPNVGFKHGAWRDVGWWSRPLQTLSNAPVPPRPFSQLSES